MNKEMLLKCINEAQQRVDNVNFPLDVRIRSRITLNDCIVRADREGWPLQYAGDSVWTMREQP